MGIQNQIVGGRRQSSGTDAGRRARSTTLALAALFSSAATCALAQAADTASDENSRREIEEVIVTARLRGETLISAPVAVSAVSQAEIERRALVRLQDMVKSVPQLVISEAGNGHTGAVILVRGIGVGDGNPFAEQAVSFNIDGFQVSRGNARRLSQFDMEQIEVLKGPQALFFGKNSPGGLIVIRTQDPTDEFEAGINVSHEFVGDEYRADGYVSGPLAPGLRARLMLYGGKVGGYFDNVAVFSPLSGPFTKTLPSDSEYGGRLTLNMDLGPKITGRLKLNYGQLDGSGSEVSAQVVDCPLGFSQSAAVDNCKADGNVVHADPGPRVHAFNPNIKPKTFIQNRQTMGSYELNYDPTPQFKITSITGYYRVDTSNTGVFTTADSTRPNLIATTATKYGIKEYAQELRLTSDLPGPLNFILSGYAQHAELRVVTQTVTNTVTPAVRAPPQLNTQSGNAYSAFGQASYDITDTIELSGGVRYSYEKKNFAVYDPNYVKAATPVPRQSWNNWSPEATLAWRPDNATTAYISYKRGFLSGGFNSGAGALTSDRSYDQQEVKGVEGGLKLVRFDGVRANIAAYRYDVTGLQVNTNITTAAGLTIQQVENAGRARVQGIEVDVNAEVTDNLSLYGAVGYNHARYRRFTSSCYSGQTIAQGCNLLPNAAGVFTNQNLAGKQLARAPDWTVQGGMTYTTELTEARTLAFSLDGNYSSGLFAQANNKPGSRQDAFATFDAGVTFTDEKRGYTLSLLGRNLGNKYVFYKSIDAVFTGTGTGTNLPTATPSDTVGSVARGREILLRLSYKIGS